MSWRRRSASARMAASATRAAKMTQPATAPPMTDGLGPLGELDEPSLLEEEDVPLAPLLEAAVDGAPVGRCCVGVEEGAGDITCAAIDCDAEGDADEDEDGGVLVKAMLPPGDLEAETAVTADADGRALVLALAEPLGAKESDGGALAVTVPLGEDAWLCVVEGDGDAEALEDAETDEEPVRVRPVETVWVGVCEPEGVDESEAVCVGVTEAVAVCVDESDPEGVAACERD